MNAVTPLPGPRTGPALDALMRPLRDVRISLLDQCNFRCPYCMPAGVKRTAMVPRGSWLSPDEVVRFVQAAAAHGVSKVRLTGGEPLLRPDLEEIVAAVATVPGIDDIAVTTNGALLGKRAASLRRAGLDRLTISLDALEPSRFREMSGGRGSVGEVLRAIATAEDSGFRPLKINCVVERDRNDDQVLPLAAHFRRSGHVLRFIEYMDVGNCNGWQPGQVVPSAELRTRIAGSWPLVALPPSRPGEVATRWRYADGGGEVGFISSVSEPFCGGCNRLRLGADGRLYTCLFAHAGRDLRPLLAPGSEAALAERLGAVWRVRADRYSELRGSSSSDAKRPSSQGRVEMYRVGG